MIGKKYKRKSNGNEVIVTDIEDDYVFFIERSVKTCIKKEMFDKVFEKCES